MSVSSNRYLLFAAVWMATCSIAAAQSGSAAPGGATNAAAPGGATSSVAPSGAAPQAAPGTLPQQAAPGTLPPQAAPGSLPPQAAPGGAPGFIPSTGGTAGGGATPGTVSPPSTSSGQAGSMIGQPNVSSSAPATAPASTPFNGTPTTLGLNFATDGNGLRLNGVVGDSFAQQAGLMAGDTIVGVNGQTVKTQGELQTMMQRAFSANAPLSIFVRRNGQIQSIGIPLPNSTAANGTMGTNTGASATAFRGFTDGVSFSTGVANGGIRSAGGDNGLQVSQVRANSWAANAGLQANDRIMGVNGQPVASDLRLSSLLQSALEQNTSAQIMVNRDGVIRTLTVNRPAGFVNSSPPSAGNFSADFGRFAGDFTQAVQQAQQNSTVQFQQLNHFNDRISALRGLIMSSTGQSADSARIAEQLRSLRSDLTDFNAQTGGVMQSQIQEFLARLGQLNPPTAQAPSSSSGSATSGTSPTTPAGASGTANNPANVPSAGSTTAGSPGNTTPR